ncbi:lactonohydrolase [Phyllosticta citribraziliensis]|uniref:Lactonohydrolase n=1 Tax=Phyllosticta citribraziliensis TaxID=989973 RepID=A0ABR1M0W1_9PEZI
MAAVPFVSVDLLALATNPSYFSTLPATSGVEPAVSLLSYHDSFKDLLGPNATAKLIGNYSHQAFHEGGVYNKETNTMIISSNYDVGPPPDNINITILSLDDWSIQSTAYPDLWNANGGTSYYPPGSNTSAPPRHQVWADEGDLEHPSSLVSVDVANNKTEVILNSFLGGRNFSSINDVRQHSQTGDIWFTDADYGWFQYFRPEATVPKQVYRFEPGTGVIQVVADGFVEPNGLEFSPDEKTLYVTDSGAAQWMQFNYTRPSTVYAYDIIDNKRLANRRTFAFADNGVPDGIHADTEGNLWVANGDGVHVWNPEGILIGKIYIGETSNNFAFIPGGVLVFTNNRLWLVSGIKAQGREICKDFGVGC